MTASLQIQLLGVRGSVPVHGPAFARFGGATSCVFCLAGKEAILLDAGSGLLWEELPQALPEKHFSVLLTHAHVDHILGFPMFAPLFDKTYGCDVYLKYRQGRSAKEQVIRHVLASCPALDPAQAVMVGDRRYDIIGAHANGLKAIGVLYGYGSREELAEAGADCIVRDLEELERVICGESIDDSHRATQSFLL